MLRRWKPAMLIGGGLAARTRRREPLSLNAPVRRHITRRGIQIALGLLWILDGLLQFQPAMLTSKFAVQVIAPAGQGQQVFVAFPVREAARIILLHPAAMDVGFGLIQLALGLGILWRRTTRQALAASVAWALLVWYLGEGLGGLFGNDATLLTGAPGAALVYAVLALTVQPQGAHAAGGRRPWRWATMAWAALWLGGAVLQLLPGRNTNASVSMSLAMNASGAPGWFAAAGNRLSALVPHAGVSIVVDLVVLQAFAGLGVFMARRARMAALILGVSLSLIYWIAGQDMGRFWSGLATDPGTAPLIILLAIAVDGCAPWREPEGDRPGLASPARLRRARTGVLAATPQGRDPALASGADAGIDGGQRIRRG